MTNKSKRLRIPRQIKWFWVVGLVAIAICLLSVSSQSRSLDSEASRLGELLNLKPGSVVSEIGAGTGDLTLYIAERIGPSGTI